MCITAALSSAASGQLSVSGTVFEGTLPDLVQVSPQIGTAILYDCDLVAGDLLYSLIGYRLSISGSTRGNYSVNYDAHLVSTPAQLAESILRNRIDEIIPGFPCEFGIDEDLGVVRGGINLYTVTAGVGFGGRFCYTRRATAVVSFADTIEIESSIAANIEVPLHISGSVLAAESFGDPEQTRGTARLSLIGSLGEEAFSQSVEVESVSVIPEQASIDVTRLVQLSVMPGITSVPISVSGTAFGEATAVGVGFIVGACTVAVDFPNTIRIGRFRAIGGGALPAGITIRSGITGGIIQTSGGSVTCPADFNQDGGIDGDDVEAFFAAWENGETSADVNQDGGIDGADVSTFFVVWEAGGC